MLALLLTLLMGSVPAEPSLPDYEIHEVPAFRYAVPREDRGIGDALISKINGDLLVITDELGVQLPRKPLVIFCEGRVRYDRTVREISGADPPDWSVALAFPGRGIMVLSGDSSRIRAPIEHYRTITHEIVHLVLGAGRPTLPRWYHEGVAQLLSGESVGDETGTELAAWAFRGELLPLSELDTYISHGRNRVEIFYRQSLSFVAFATSEHGRDLHRRLLRELSDPRTSIAVAYERATGVTLADDEARWHEYLAAQFSLGRYLFGLLGPWSGLAFICAAGYFYQRRRRRRQLERMAIQEAREDLMEQLQGDQG